MRKYTLVSPFSGTAITLALRSTPMAFGGQMPESEHQSLGTYSVKVVRVVEKLQGGDGRRGLRGAQPSSVAKSIEVARDSE